MSAPEKGSSAWKAGVPEDQVQEESFRKCQFTRGQAWAFLCRKHDVDPKANPWRKNHSGTHWRWYRLV